MQLGGKKQSKMLWQQMFAERFRRKQNLQKGDATKLALKTLHKHDHSSTAIKSLYHTCRTTVSSFPSDTSRKYTVRAPPSPLLGGRTPLCKRVAQAAAYATMIERYRSLQLADTDYCSYLVVSMTTTLSPLIAIEPALTTVDGD